MSINLRTILKGKQIMEQIGKFFQTVDFGIKESQTSNFTVSPSSKLYNIISRLSFLLPGRLPHSSYPVELASHVPTIDYGLVSYYSGNWSAPKRSWFSRNWSRIEIMRCAVSSNSQGPSKPDKKENKLSNIGINSPQTQGKLKIEEPKISDAETKKVASHSAEAEILDIGAKLEKAKAKDSEAEAKVINMNATTNPSSSLRLGEVSAKESDTVEKVEKKKIETNPSSTDTEFGKVGSEQDVSEKKLGAMQAKLGVVEAKLSEPPQAKFSGADYALKPKELLREISQCRQAKTQKKIVIDNANESGFFKKIKKMRLEKWKRYPRTRMEDCKCKKSTKDEKSPKN